MRDLPLGKYTRDDSCPSNFLRSMWYLSVPGVVGSIWVGYEDRYCADTSGCSRRLNPMQCISLTLGCSRPLAGEVCVCVFWGDCTQETFICLAIRRDSRTTSTNNDGRPSLDRKHDDYHLCR